MKRRLPSVKPEPTSAPSAQKKCKGEERAEAEEEWEDADVHAPLPSARRGPSARRQRLRASSTGSRRRRSSRSSGEDGSTESKAGSDESWNMSDHDDDDDDDDNSDSSASHTATPSSDAPSPAASQRKHLRPPPQHESVTRLSAGSSSPAASSFSRPSTSSSPVTARVLRSAKPNVASPRVHPALPLPPSSYVPSPSLRPTTPRASFLLPCSSTHTYPSNHLLNIPFDPFALVCSFLHPIDLIRLTTVSQGCRMMARDSSLWAPLVAQSWPITCEHAHPWHSVYVGRIQRALAGALFFCTTCDCTKAFPTQALLSKHQARCRSLPSPSSLPCTHPGCSRTFPFPAKLQEHLRDHAKARKFRCSFPGCTKSYPSRYHLRNHQCRHTGQQRPYPCTVEGCTRSFNNRAALRTHQATHSKDGTATPRSQWRCTAEGCGRVYSSKSALNSHAAKRHSEQQERFKCPQCGHGFFYHCHLTKHTRQVHAQRATA